MNILAMDSSAITASAAVISDGKVIAEDFLNNGLTHSETLAPMVAQTIEKAGMKLFDMDVIAVTHGPGSFTGVRIGVSFAKGLAQPMEIPCLGVSTLAAAAYRHRDSGRVILACMDARCQQVYGAFFEGKNGVLTRLTQDAAFSVQQAAQQLSAFGKNAVICGDGTQVMSRYLAECPDARKLDIRIPQGDERFQRASDLGLLAEYELLYTDRTPVAPKMLCPVYLRPSQAERELAGKKNKTPGT